jgi:hypothetical protein
LSYWPYAHDWFEDEIFTENAQDWDEVVARVDDPRVMKFKAMSWEEKTTSLERIAQDILRTREGMISYKLGEAMGNPQEDIEATGDYRESLVQTKDSPQIQVA